MLMADRLVQINDWEPKNYTQRYQGSVSLTQAFASSINTIAVQLYESVGREAVISTARNLGISSPLAPYASLALGTSEVSLLELTSAYAAIAAGAYPVKPWGAAGSGAKPADGGRPPKEAGRWQLAKAHEMRNLLSSVIRSGTGHRASLPITAFGKTGTSQEYRDAWFIGFAGNLVVGVWVGNDDFTPMKRVTGGSLPAQIWKRFMTAAMKSDPAFQPDLPRIVSFEARPSELPNFTMDMVSFDTVVVVVDAKTKRRTTYGQTLMGTSLHREAAGGGSVSSQRLRAPRSRLDFDQQLSRMGWPGH